MSVYHCQMVSGRPGVALQERPHDWRLKDDCLANLYSEFRPGEFCVTMNGSGDFKLFYVGS